MTTPSAQDEVFDAPHLRTTSELYELANFWKKANREERERWCNYVQVTVRSLRDLYRCEPSATSVRKGVAVGLKLSETFRQFVTKVAGGAEEARDALQYDEIVQAGAGTIVEQCRERSGDGRPHG